MTRGLATAISNATDDPFLVPVVFLELQFGSGTLRLHTDLGTIGTDSDDTPYRWDFTSTTHSFSTVNASLTAGATAVRLLGSGAGSSVAIRSNAAISAAGGNIDGSVYRYVRVRASRRAGSSYNRTLLYYVTGSHAASASYAAIIEKDCAIGEWVIYEFDMWNLDAGGTDWQDATDISQVYFYPEFSSATADWDIDYIEIVPAWYGTGDLGSIDEIEETEEIAANAVRCRLSGIDSTILDEAVNQDYYEKPARILISMRDTVTGALVANPHEVFYGKMDVMRFLYGKDQSAVEIVLESELADFDKAAMKYYSDSQLQRDYSGDLGLRYLAQLVDARIMWGKNNATLVYAKGGRTGTQNASQIIGNALGMFV